jgi:MoxR-like ATPase
VDNRTSQVLSKVGGVIIGKDDVVKKLFISILSGGHILLEDVPGVGKTTLALAFSRVLDLSYSRIQFTSDTMPSDVVGFSVYNKAGGAFEYRPGAVMANLLLADEINRTSSKTQSALLEVMEEGGVTVDGVTRPVPEPFTVIATQNPVGSAGTQLLPSSQLDRFMVRLEMGYPDFDSQVSILRDRHTENPLDRLAPVLSGGDILQMRAEARAVHVDDAVYAYVARLAEATRSHPLVQLGISPRGALALTGMAKAAARAGGRDYLTPDDVAAMFVDVCAHRLVLQPKARITETRPADVLGEILAGTELPAVG